MNKLKNLLLYAGVDKKDYEAVRPKIDESNRNSLSSLTCVTFVSAFILLFLSFFIEILKSSQIGYIACLVISFLIFFAARKAKGKRWLINLCMYVFISILLLFGIVLGTFAEPNQASVSFAVLLFAVPLLFTDAPLRSNIPSVISIIIYFILAANTQSEEMLQFNLSAILPYGIISIIVSSLLMRMKVKSHVLEMNNVILSITDQLTGMLNRRSYEKKITELKENGVPKGLIVCSFDVNGLKTINDNIGHNAGDELICGASKCIENTFGSYGLCYRTGGDEFVAILDDNKPIVDELSDNFKLSMAEFKGTYVTKLSISAGIAVAGENADITTLLAEAEKAMYSAKNDYYIKNGLDRRKT